MSLPGDENPNPQWQLPQGPQWQSGSPLGPDAEEQQPQDEQPPPWQQPQEQPAWQHAPPQWQQQQPAQPNPGWVAPPRTPGQAYAAMILGIVGLFPICPVVLSIVGLILGIMAKNEIDGAGGQLGGRGIAMAGIILSAVGIALYALFFIAIFAIGDA
jgi:hypothetical protein